jgi:hypothetical protein
VVFTLLGWLKVVVRERRRAENGEGKGAEIRLMVRTVASSIVVSSPSKKLIRSGTALAKVSVGIGGRSMELVLLLAVSMMKMTASDGQLRLEADVVWWWVEC